MLLLTLLPAAQAQTFDAVGSCPGVIDLTVAGMTPNGVFGIVSADGTGSVTIPAGQPCAGTVLGLGPVGITQRATLRADATGAAHLSPNVPGVGCGLALQAIDVTTCTTTNVQFLPRPIQQGTISDLQNGIFALYDVVELSGVVTATDAGGLWVQNGPGAQWGGLYVFLGPGWDVTWGPVAQGDLVTAIGEYREYYDLTELNVDASPARDLQVVGHTATPTPVVVTMASLSAYAEPWEGVTIEVRNVTVATLPDAHGEWTVTSGANTLVVDDQIYAATGLTVGQSLSYLRGPLSYSFGTYRILPRSAADLH